MDQELANERLVVEIASLARRFAIDIVKKDATEDIAQDVVLQCLMKIRAGRWRIDPADLADFVRRVVRRRAVDLWRRSQARKQRDAEYALETQDSPTWMSPELAYEERELAELHERALERLPELCRRAYLMVRDEGETYESAAARLGIQPHAVSKHMVRAQERLRRALARRGITGAARRSRRARGRPGRSRSEP